jgi:hypothetical protein
MRVRSKKGKKRQKEYLPFLALFALFASFFAFFDTRLRRSFGQLKNLFLRLSFFVLPVSSQMQAGK